ncbi:hypothetical protein [Noviherbaspirillum saxi]|uniref:Uncharacterized protein n=1 Tax=Noviherbaspirillum saxi TaxID=2320863 RepID=A0A3A3FSW3_9BURK|nr:hypothetical protein [Noviherbaspirillum saxi]RJF99307.1 hypothetical protein D3871_12840 [Noviherbaspirillum saxi]
MSASTRTTLAICIAAASLSAHAQSRGPAAQYWVDLATTSFSIPGMPEEGGMGGGLLGGLMGNTGMPGAGGGRGKTLDAELFVRAKPAGVEGTHAIPTGMSMGPSLLLMPLRPKSAGQDATRNERPDTIEKPKGRILMYWGCGDTIRPGQPKVFDFAKQNNTGEYAQFFASHGAGSRGVEHRPGHALWPNEKDSKQVPDNASLQGDHAVSGEGVPASLKFSVGAEYDFLPKVKLNTKGMPQDGVRVNWAAMQNARAYFLHAQGAAKGPDGAQDMIFWSSSEKPENGWALMSYQSQAQITKLLQQKIILPASTNDCTVPKGIFDKVEGAMLNMIAYGPELNVSHPQRPTKAPADWQPEWTARVRIKSTGMAMLGMEGNAKAQGSGAGRSEGNEMSNGNANSDNSGMPGIPLPDVTNPVKLLRGLFGG